MTSAPPTPGPIRIGALAASTGVSVQAIRYYERRGLITPSNRRASGYREYAPETIESVKFVRHAQEMGFKLDEIGELLRLRRRVASGRAPGDDAVRAAVAAKRDDVARRIQQLEGIRNTLDGLLDACDQMCRGESRPAECPIFEAIDHADPPGLITPARRLGRSGGRARSASRNPQP